MSSQAWNGGDGQYQDPGRSKGKAGCRTCILNVLGGSALIFAFLHSLPVGLGEAASGRLAPVARAAAAAIPAIGAGDGLAATAVAAPPGEEAPAADKPDPEPDPGAAARTLAEAWAEAWSSRDVDQYLAFYGADFVPDKGLSRQAWEQSRRQKIRGKKNIAVALRDLEVAEAGDGRLKVSFVQDYAADGFRETGTRKELLLAREGEAWRIVVEEALSGK